MKTVNSLADIAKIAGTTAATVSRALNDSPEIGQKTKQKIRKIAADHNYTPNASARNLRLKKTNAVAVILNRSDRLTGEFSEQPFVLSFLGNLCDELSTRGLDMMVSSQRSVSKGWDEHFVKAQRADGIIVLGQGKDLKALARLSKLQTPFVVYGAFARQRSYCVIGSDSMKGAAMATNHLIQDAGRNTILYLGPTNNFEGKQRMLGYQATLQEHRLQVNDNLVADCALSYQSARQAMSRILAEGEVSFNGIFCCNDEIAFGAIKSLQYHGKNVPQDISVVGFDDTPAATYFTPSLTTVRQQRSEISKLLVDNLLLQIDGKKAKSKEIPVELVIRSSSTPKIKPPS